MSNEELMGAWVVGDLSDKYLRELKDETVLKWLNCIKKAKRILIEKVEILNVELECRKQLRELIILDGDEEEIEIVGE